MQRHRAATSALSHASASSSRQCRAQRKRARPVPQALSATLHCGTSQRLRSSTCPLHLRYVERAAFVLQQAQCMQQLVALLRRMRNCVATNCLRPTDGLVRDRHARAQQVALRVGPAYTLASQMRRETSTRIRMRSRADYMECCPLWPRQHLECRHVAN